MKINEFKELLKPIIDEVIDELGSAGEAQRICDKCKRLVPCDQRGYVPNWTCPACRAGEGKPEKVIDEVSATGGVAAPATKFFAGKVKDKVQRSAGYTPVGKIGNVDEKVQLNENTNFDIRKEFYLYTTKTQQVKSAFEALLSKKLIGKKVSMRARKGVKTNIYLKNYVVEVSSVQFDGTDIVLKDEGGKPYFVDKNYMIQIVEPTAPAPAPEAKPEAKPETPTTGTGPAAPAPLAKPKSLSKELGK